MACLGPPPAPLGKRGRASVPPADNEALPAACTLTAFGLAAALHETAAPAALEELLQPWSGDRCVTIDRYDVRNLLPQWAPPAAARGWCARCDDVDVEEAGVSTGDLAAERFADLWALERSAADQEAEAEARTSGMRTRGARRRRGRREQRQRGRLRWQGSRCAVFAQLRRIRRARHAARLLTVAAQDACRGACVSEGVNLCRACCWISPRAWLARD